MDGARRTRQEIPSEIEALRSRLAELEAEVAERRGPRAAALAGRDDEECTRAQRALRESEERYRVVSELVSDYAYSFRVEPDGGLDSQWSTGAIERITGWGFEELKAEGGWEKLLHPDDLPIAESQLRGLMAGEASTVEYRIRTRSGQVLWMSDHARPVRDGDGRICQIVGAVRDVTERKRAEKVLADHRGELEELVAERTRELERSREKILLSERLATVGTLAAGIAHQINNPLGAILNAAEFALGCDADPESRAIWRQALEDNMREAKHCGKIVRSMLQFSRNEPTEKWVEDIDVTLRRACLITRSYASERKAEVGLESRAGEAAVRMNPIEMEEALVNVIRNAIESRSEGARVVVRSWPGSDAIRIEVGDDGRGLAPEELERVFDPFYTTRLSEGGTGIGLSVTHGVVTDHGGTIEMKSAPGQGTRVTIELPLAQSSSER